MRNGIDISGYKARRVRGEDFRSFDHILALDPQNLRNLRAIAPADTRARLSLLMDHVPGKRGQGVRDPYYGTDRDFEIVWDEGAAGGRCAGCDAAEGEALRLSDSTFEYRHGPAPSKGDGAAHGTTPISLVVGRSTIF